MTSSLTRLIVDIAGTDRDQQPLRLEWAHRASQAKIALLSAFQSTSSVNSNGPSQTGHLETEGAHLNWHGRPRSRQLLERSSCEHKKGGSPELAVLIAQSEVWNGPI